MSGIIKISIILFVIPLFIVINFNIVEASYLTASKYEIEMIIDNPREVTSDTINLNLDLDNESIVKKNIYLENFILENSAGTEIPPRYIKIETPHLLQKESLDKQHRFLISKMDQEKSWFRISLAKEAAFLEPGEYTGFINIDDLDWEIKVSVLIKSFVNFSINDNTFELEITEAAHTNFFIADDLCEINIESNYSNWEIKAHLEKFTNEAGNNLEPEFLFYRLEEVNRKTDLENLTQEQFSNFKENDMIIMINGKDYKSGLIAIRFAVDLLRDNNSVQPSGLYRGKLIFTLRSLNNM